MSYIHSTKYQQVKRAIELAEKSTASELITLVKREVSGKGDIDVTKVTDHAVIVDGDSVFIELEFEYFNSVDRCLINTVTVRVN